MEVRSGSTYLTAATTTTATSSDQRLYYDSLPFGQIGVGNNTKQEDWVSGTTYASSTRTFNSYELIATSTDRRGNATSYVYDAYNLFPATTTNALLQRTNFYYNYSNGKVKQSSDPNSSLTKNVFDGLGRITEIDVSSTTTPTTYATTTTFVYVDSTSTSSYIKRSDWLSVASTTDTYQLFDGLNRIFQERKTSPTSGTFNVVDRIYNTAGLVASTSLPYSSAGASSTAVTTTSSLYTNYLYDALKRPLTISNAVGTTTNTYGKWITTTTDPNGNVKDYWSDAFGNLVNVVEHISASSIATTTYSYDALNNLATTTDSLGNVRRFTYDGLSRRLTAQDLHAPSDAAFGTCTYSYDDQGNVTSQTDPKSQVVNRTYDALNRMLTEDYTGQGGTEVTLTYDNCTNGIGYLCSASSTSATSTNAYDILGRITSATTTILGSKYNMQYTYDRQGNVTLLTYPNSSQVAVTYNLAGLPSRMQRKPSGGSFTDIVTSFTYAPTGQTITTVFGNGASTTRTYDAASLYRLTQLQTLANGSNVQNFTYTYDTVGNITQISNYASASSSAKTIFSYDALNRLLTASTTAASSTPYRQQYWYDLLGSILSLRSGSASSTYTYADTGYANPHALTQLSNGYSTSTFSYDNNGNLVQKTINGTSTTYVWDYANRLIALGISGAGTTTYGYDAFGSRVLQTGTTTTFIYPSKFYSIASSTLSGAKYATTTEYVWSGDTQVAYVERGFVSGVATGTAATYYLHPDHLGSTNVISNASGTIVTAKDYYPYGSVRVNSGSASLARGYIGEFSDQSNLSYLNARYYDPARGQFLSQDPVFWETQDLADPQSFNTYSYAMGNPITKKDPLGRDAYGDYFLNYYVPSQRAQIALGNFSERLSSNEVFDFATNHPYMTSGALAIGGASVGVPAFEAFGVANAAADAFFAGNMSGVPQGLCPLQYLLAQQLIMERPCRVISTSYAKQIHQAITQV